MFLEKKDVWKVVLDNFQQIQIDKVLQQNVLKLSHYTACMKAPPTVDRKNLAPLRMPEMFVLSLRIKTFSFASQLVHYFFHQPYDQQRYLDYYLRFLWVSKVNQLRYRSLPLASVFGSQFRKVYKMGSKNSYNWRSLGLCNPSYPFHGFV